MMALIRRPVAVHVKFAQSRLQEKLHTWLTLKIIRPIESSCARTVVKVCLLRKTYIKNIDV